MKNWFDRIWQSIVIFSLVLTPVVWAKVTIYMCGDSTMQDWVSGYFPKQGQGQDFHFWFNSELAAVVNRGQGGMAADGYYDMFWKSGCSAGNCIVDKLQKGDYAVIQFGINDVSKSDEAKFTVAMSQMAKEAEAKGVTPILMSPIRRCYFDSPTAIHNSYRGYPARAKAIADSLGIAFIDMSEMVANYMISVGEFYSQQFVFNFATKSEYSNLGSDQADQVHLQMNGANAFGRIITEQMRANSDAMTKMLGNYMAPMYQVDVKVSPEGASKATSIGAYYPEGMTVMLKTVPNDGYKFVGWYDGDGNKVSGNAVSTVVSPYIYTFNMGNKSTQFTAVYESGAAQKYTGNGKALTSFPKTTPKSLDDVSFEPFTPIGGSTETEVPVDSNIVKYFDAYKPDTSDGYSESEWAHTGEGYFNFAETKNSFATYRMRFPGAGYVTLAVRYANGSTSERLINAYLDHDYYVSALPTGGWDKWKTAYVVMDAPQGETDLKFMTITVDGPNIDAFGFNIEGVCRANDSACIAEVVAKEDSKDSTDKKDTTTSIRSIQQSLNLNSAEPQKVNVFDMRGRKVVQFQMNASANLQEQLNGRVKESGLYLVTVRSGSLMRKINWAKVQ